MVDSTESQETMKKVVYISFFFAFILAFASCKKEVIQPNSSDSGENAPYQVRSGGENGDVDVPPYQVRGGEGGELSGGGDGVVDPDEDEDFDTDDTVVDPDEDEDFDKEENVVDPDEDEDFEEDEDTDR
jgi:hypothetical protein